MPESLVWHDDKNINIFSLLKNNTKTTTQSMQMHWMMGANADQYDRSTMIISRNCPVFPKILTEETAPNMVIQLQHIWWNHPFFFFHLQSHLMYYTYNRINHPTIIIFTKFSIGFTTSYRHITKRERGIHTINIWSCAEKYIKCFNRSVHFPRVCCIPTNSIKVSTMTEDFKIYH